MGQCLGPPLVQHGGGRRAQLLKLRASVHPVSGAKLPQPTLGDYTPVSGMGTYSNLKTGDTPIGDGFVKYVPDLAKQPTTVARGIPSAEKRALIFAKVKLKEACAKRRRRRRAADEEAKVLYDELLGDAYATAVYYEGEPVECDIDDDDSRVFWEELGAESAADSLFKHCAKAPRLYAQVGSKRSRLDRLMG